MPSFEFASVVCRFRARLFSLLFALTALAVYSADAFGAGAPMYTVYGPRTFTRTTGKPTPITETFTVRVPGASSTLRVVDGGITSAVVSVNGATVLSPSDF